MQANNNLRESKDLSLSELPGRKIYDKKTRTSSWVTTLPLILRDLAPTSGFNPQTAWKERQERDAGRRGEVGEEEEQIEIIEVQPQANGGKKKKKKQGLSRAEIIQKNIEDKKKEAKKFETQRIAAVSKENLDDKTKQHIASKIKSISGKQETLLHALSNAIRCRDKADAFDILWALEEMNSEIAGKDVDLVRSWRGTGDIVNYQLKEMSDRLPPLSKYNSKFELDDWQVDVLRMIDAQKSVVISAPTSSGKTVISTYVASLSSHLQAGGKSRVLFVVPTEPLVWQVAAHFHKHIHDGSVALVTNQLTYSPHQNSSTPPAIIVGTPLALESALTRIRGKHASSESFQNLDRSKLVGGFDHYDWVVYDEIHALDGAEGAALQRLIRLMNCKFLALSATIGNAEELRQWMDAVRGEQVNATLVDVVEPEVESESESAEEAQLVMLKVHQSRFMNLQRHVWQDAALCPLHPLAAITHDFLVGNGFKQAALAMTPKDSIDMFEAMNKFYPAGSVAHLHPNIYFAESVNGMSRITLQKSKEYEDTLKNKLTLLAQSHPEETQTLLADYTLTDSNPQFNICDLVLSLKSQDMTPCLLFHLNVFELITLFQQLVEELETRQHECHPDHYSKASGVTGNAAKAKKGKGKGNPNLKEEEMERQQGTMQNTNEEPDNTQPHKNFSFLPGGPIDMREFNDICADVAKRDNFEGDIKDHALMRALKRGIGLYIDDHHFTAYRVAVMKLAMQGKLGVVLSDASLAYGVNMPFRTCVFCGEMGGQLDTLMAQQMAGRSGRRGMDTQGHLVYAGASSNFMQELMLARIPAITGKEPRYHSSFLQEMLSPYANPVGYYPHQMMTLGGQSLRDSIMEGEDGVTVLPNFRQESIGVLLQLQLIEECEQLAAENIDAEHLDFAALVTPSGHRPRLAADEARVSCAKLWTVWELRSHVPESLLLGCLLPAFYREFFIGQADRDGETIPVQIKFCLFLILTCERQPYHADFAEGGHYAEPLSAHPFLQNHLLGDRVAEWEGEIATIQDTIAGCHTVGTEWMLLSPDVAVGSALDATLFDCIVNPGTALTLPPQAKQFVKESLTSLSLKLLKIHNNLMRDKDSVRDPISHRQLPGRYAQFESITRKCFTRLQYISRALIQDIVDFPNNTVVT